MAGQIVVIRGGTLVTGYRTMQADLWIEDGIIRRIGKDTLAVRRAGSGQRLKVFDASEYYVLPGLIKFARTTSSGQLHHEQYKRYIRSLIASGVTTILHTLKAEPWMTEEEIGYLLTPHFNSSLDYGIRIGVDVNQFTSAYLRLLRDSGFRLIEVTIYRHADIRQIDWTPLYQLAYGAQLAFHLRISPEAVISRAERSDIIELWTADCQYGQIRTCIDGAEPRTLYQPDLFYRVALISTARLPSVLRRLQRDWYGYLPAFCPYDRWNAPLDTRGSDPERLLSLYIRLASTNAAKAIGWYPQKGSLTPGADADLWLLKKAEWLTNFDVSTMLNLSEVCQPAYVMSKGRWIYRQGTYMDAVGSGRCLRDVRCYNYVM
ncbi:MAG: amidohydrolase family protein [Brevibacillus sp.]|nr:amidohydrolase family protein [Brevibacillus sp.]